MHLVVLDLIPALLSWEGRDVSEEPDAAPGAAHALGHLYDAFQVIGVSDAGTTSAILRRHLEQLELIQFFDSVLTSAEHGPGLSGRAIRKIMRTAAPRERGVTVTARPALAADLRRNRMPVVMTSHAEFESVPQAVFDLAEGRPMP